MSTFEIKLTPKKTKPFGTAHLIVATKLKRITVPYPVSSASFLASVEAQIHANTKSAFSVSIGDEEVKVKAFDKSLKLASFEWKSKPAKDVPPGRHKLRVHVMESKGVDDDGQTYVDFPFLIEDPPEEDEPYTFESLIADKLLVVPSSVARAMDRFAEDKAVSIYARGSGYKGHGPTDVLGSGALHTHVTNGTALGYKWKGKVLHIVGWGEKSDSAGSGTSGYNWTE